MKASDLERIRLKAEQGDANMSDVALLMVEAMKSQARYAKHLSTTVNEIIEMLERLDERLVAMEEYTTNYVYRAVITEDDQESAG